MMFVEISIKELKNLISEEPKRGFLQFISSFHTLIWSIFLGKNWKYSLNSV